MHQVERRGPHAWAMVLAAAALAALLAACGGGGSTYASGNGGVGSGGTGIAFGTVNGFGSVIVDGTAYDSASPVYLGIDATGAPAAVAATSVDLGARLSVQLDAQGRPSTVLIAPALSGAVASLTQAGFTINGVAVRVNVDPAAGPVTRYAGIAGYQGLSGGMQLEVDGAFGIDANGTGFVAATLIRQLPPTNTILRSTGVVAALDAAAGTFTLGTRTVRFAPGLAPTPAGTPLANGQVVHVWSNQPLAADGSLSAGAIAIDTLPATAGQAQVGGLVMQLHGSRLQLSGIAVDASAPALAATVATLRAGQYVVAQGPVDPASGVLLASSLKAYSAQGAAVELKGTITAYVSNANFLVRGVAVDASQAALGAGVTLGDGVFVEIHGVSSDSNVVTASSVTVSGAAPDGSTVDYRGTVSNLNLGAGTTQFTLSYSLDGVAQTAQVTLAPNVQFSQGSAAQLVDGASIEIEATRSAGALSAFDVAVVPAAGDSDQGLETSGIVYGYDGSSLMVNGLTIQLNGVLPSSGVLANGVRAEVAFTVVGGVNIANEIDIEQ